MSMPILSDTGHILSERWGLGLAGDQEEEEEEVVAKEGEYGSV